MVLVFPLGEKLGVLVLFELFHVCVWWKIWYEVILVWNKVRGQNTKCYSFTELCLCISDLFGRFVLQPWRHLSDFKAYFQIVYQGNLRLPSSHLKFLVQQLQSGFHISQVQADNNSKQGWFNTSFKAQGGLCSGCRIPSKPLFPHPPTKWAIRQQIHMCRLFFKGVLAPMNGQYINLNQSNGQKGQQIQSWTKIMILFQQNKICGRWNLRRCD